MPGESIWGGKGQVYEDYRDGSTGISGVFYTTAEEDQEIILYMSSQVGKIDIYNVLLSNCRDYSENQFDYIIERGIHR